jgi:LacI family transcriptional regulator
MYCAKLLSITIVIDNNAMTIMRPDIQKRPTIKDVALSAGVSTQTVSRVVNGYVHVSEKTRLRVEEAIQQSGYRPSTLARSLIQKRSYTLGIVTAGLNHTGPSRTLNGVTDKADELGYMLLLKKLPSYETNEVEQIIDSLIDHHVDGIIWAVPEVADNRNWVEKLTSLPVPMVFIAMEPREGLSVVSTDSYAGAKMATEHLIEQGCRNIGHLAGPQVWWEAGLRLLGWRNTLEVAGLPARDSQWVAGNWSPASGVVAAEQLLDNFPEMDGVFVANDQMALSLLLVANRRGIKVPEQLAVIGFDGIPDAAYFLPPLSTIEQDPQALGGQAIENIVTMIQAYREGREYLPESILITPKLIVRDSSERTIRR